ncbi:MAG TPA: CU044_5270 family protein [Streptosporangiaceae bacterium]|jgi:hypothetical protein|nr:CU044_5270 family protein [Streptosporangiaceae bacterium]
MDELSLVARLRDDVPGIDLATPERRLADDIAAALTAAPAAWGHESRERLGREPAAPRRRRGSRRRVVVAGAVAAAAVAAATVVIVVRGQPAHDRPVAIAPRPTAAPAPGPAATSAQLVAYATRAAAAAPPFNPKPGDWIYFKTLQATSSKGEGGMLFGPPDGKAVQQSWTQVSGLPGGGEPGGWPNTSYPYLDSLPSNPAKLTAIIEAGLKAQNYVIGSGNIGVFNAIEALMENMVLSPKLLAALYGVLANDPAVHFDPRVTDFAGQTGVAFYTYQEGYLKEEIVVNPKTYAYMGDRYVTYRAHDLPAAVNNGIPSGPYTHFKKGQITGEAAVLDYGIVAHRGEVP